MKALGAVLVLVMTLGLVSCSSEDAEPDRVRGTLLQPTDLPVGDPDYSYPTEPGGGGVQVDALWSCPTGRLFADTGYVEDYVAYDLGPQGRVFSFLHTNDARDVASDFADIVETWRTCVDLGYQQAGDAGDGRSKTVTEVDRGTDTFGFRTTTPNGDVYGETALRVVGDSIVQVTALGVQFMPTEVSVDDLLDTAVRRAR